MKFKESLFSYSLRKKIISNKNLKQNKIKIRPASHIMRNIIIICAVLFLISVFSGILFGDNILFLINSKSKNPLEVEGKIWVPIILFFAVLLLYFWGIVIIFGGITAYLMKSKTMGIIKKSEIRSFYDSDDGDIYYIFSEVKYNINGFEYHNEGRHIFSSNNNDKAKEKLNSISPGDKILIFYDPKNPYLMNLECNDYDIKGEILAGTGFITGAMLLSIFLGTILRNI